MALDAILELIASIIASATVISGVVYAMFKKVTKEIREDQAEIRRLVESNDKINCKIALNSFLNKVNDNSIESIDEEECRLYYDLYDHYKDDLHGNSYIHDKWARVMNK